MSGDRHRRDELGDNSSDEPEESSEEPEKPRAGKEKSLPEKEASPSENDQRRAGETGQPEDENADALTGEPLRESGQDTPEKSLQDSVGDFTGKDEFTTGDVAPHDELTPTKQLHLNLQETDDFVLFQDLDPTFLQTQSRYELASRIARGGMGVIYRARDRELGRDVAIKVLRHDHYDKPELVQRFIDEAHIMSYLQHPGIAPVFGFGTCYDGRPFHAMKLVQGNTLADLLHRRASLGADFAGLLSVFASVCQTLAYTHSRGIVHLDLKPSNVMVGAFAEVHLMDWGLARPVASIAPSDTGASEELTRDRSAETAAIPGPPSHSVALSEQRWFGHTVGTPAYMSPEQARGDVMDRRSDVFGLGAMLCEILTGRALYHGDRSRSILLRAARASLSKTLRRLDRCGADRSLIQLAKNCLARRPEDRLPDAGEVAKRVAAYQKSAIDRAERDMGHFFELSPDLFCIASTDGYFQRINSNFSRVLGYSEAELLTRPFIEFVHQQDREDTLQQMRNLNHGQPVVRFRNRYRAAGGAYMTLEWRAKSIPAEHVIFAVARHVDP